MTETLRRPALLLAALLVIAPPVAAQVLYKLVDRFGRVTYSDTAPKNFDGTVTRLETDTTANTLPGAKAEAAPTGEAAPPGEVVPGLAETRNQTRAALDKRVREAQARVDAARKAKAQGEAPQSDELQTIQHQYAPLAEGVPAPRPNCFHAVDPHGRPVLNCPTQVPQGSYYERRRKLDEALRVAEEELAAAERAYRRGTD